MFSLLLILIYIFITADINLCPLLLIAIYVFITADTQLCVHYC